MNKSHPFGLPIWKPALYKKSRSVVRRANRELHSSPSSAPELFFNAGNLLWFLLFGWWLFAVIFSISVLSFGEYSRVLRELSFYLLWPFGRYVERQLEIVPTHLFNHEEEVGLLSNTAAKKHVSIGPSTIIYYIYFYLIIGKQMTQLQILVLTMP